MYIPYIVFEYTVARCPLPHLGEELLRSVPELDFFWDDGERISGKFRNHVPRNAGFSGWFSGFGSNLEISYGLPSFSPHFSGRELGLNDPYWDQQAGFFMPNCPYRGNHFHVTSSVILPKLDWFWVKNPGHHAVNGNHDEIQRHPDSMHVGQFQSSCQFWNCASVLRIQDMENTFMAFSNRILFVFLGFLHTWLKHGVAFWTCQKRSFRHPINWTL